MQLLCQATNITTNLRCNLVSAIFVDFGIFQSNNSIVYPAYYDNMS